LSYHPGSNSCSDLANNVVYTSNKGTTNQNSKPVGKKRSQTDFFTFDNNQPKKQHQQIQDKSLSKIHSEEGSENFESDTFFDEIVLNSL